jgi:heat induced stress protein YflT
MTMRNPSNTPAATGHTVVGVFDGPNHAEQALNDLKNAGFSAEQVSVVAKDTGEARTMVEGSDMAGAETKGAGTGALLGGIGGGILGWLVGIGALAIPGIGPVVAAGALATTLGGAAVGAVAGGLIGALVGAGVPEEDARGYETHVREGRILLTVAATTGDQAEQARQIFDRYGGADVRAYAQNASVDTRRG